MTESITTKTSPPQTIQWLDKGEPMQATWHSEHGAGAPKKVLLVDDTLSADAAFRAASEGTGLLWQGDFQNAKALLQALARRLDASQAKPMRAKQAKARASATPRALFNAHRLAQSQRARTLGMVLIQLQSDFSVALRRAPDWREACTQAYGASTAPRVVSLRELLGVVGAYEWRKNGVAIAELGGAKIHPHYGVFSPIRGEYLSLVAHAPLPTKFDLAQDVALDIGTGTGVLAAILAQRGVAQIVATELSNEALACAQQNLLALNYTAQVRLVAADLYPSEPIKAKLVVCNPPWLPARPNSNLEQAIYDPESRMLQGFLNGLAAHLAPQGEGWLILSDLAEHLELRSRDTLLGWIAQAGLVVLGKRDIKPVHLKAKQATDLLHAARAAEVTSLWRLGAKRSQTA